MKKGLTIIICAILSFITVFCMSFFDVNYTMQFNTVVEDSIVRQEITHITKQTVELNKIYDGNKLIGYIEDPSKLDIKLKEIYDNKFRESFPNSNLSLDDDVLIIKENSLFIPEYNDDKIIKYIEDNNLFAIEAKRIDFSTDKGIYDSIYVLNEDIFKEAQTEFLEIFVSKEGLEAFKNNQQLPELTEYGSREISTYLMQKITSTNSYVTPSEILTTKKDIIDYLSYGDLEKLEYHTTVEGDTIAGVASLYNQMTADQLVAINSELLTSTTQILNPGTELNVTYFQPIVDVVVEKELITKEIVYPGETIYLDDENLREGMTRIEREYVEGSQNSKYKETWINGQLVNGELLSSEITKAPQTALVYRGSKAIPGVGTGEFRWPVDNGLITAGWYGYPGHRAVDFVNRYNRYGNVYATDRGTVTTVAYHPINGNYIIIDHNNGYVTQYNHLSTRAYFDEGTNVDKGEVIGNIGTTGYTTGPHVHLILWENGSRINPCIKLGC